MFYINCLNIMFSAYEYYLVHCCFDKLLFGSFMLYALDFTFLKHFCLNIKLTGVKLLFPCIFVELSAVVYVKFCFSSCAIKLWDYIGYFVVVSCAIYIVWDGPHIVLERSSQMLPFYIRVECYLCENMLPFC